MFVLRYDFLHHYFILKNLKKIINSTSKLKKNNCFVYPNNKHLKNCPRKKNVNLSLRQ